jgi:antitoxin component of MazEF toxin-antitoxin module
VHFIVKFQESPREQRLVTIPKHLAMAMGLEKGTEVEFKVQDQETLEITKS